MCQKILIPIDFFDSFTLLADVSLGEVLSQDLTDILKNDKFKYTNNLAASVQIFAQKSGAKLKNVGRAIGRFARRNQNNNTPSNDSNETEEANTPASSTELDDSNHDSSSMNIPDDDSHVLMENKLGEDELSSAFVSFFLNLFGGGDWYLSKSGSSYVPDMHKFIDQRRLRGDTQGTAMYPMIYFLVQTKLFNNFALARIEEKRSAKKLTADASLYFKCVHYIATHNLEYSPFDIRRIVKQITQNR